MIGVGRGRVAAGLVAGGERIEVVVGVAKVAGISGLVARGTGGGSDILGDVADSCDCDSEVEAIFDDEASALTGSQADCALEAG